MQKKKIYIFIYTHIWVESLVDIVAMDSFFFNVLVHIFLTINQVLILKAIKILNDHRKPNQMMRCSIPEILILYN